MIADDQQLIRESLKIILDSNNDFEVVACVGSGQEAIDFIMEHEVDVCLMDVRMPNMSGVECTRLLKESQPFPMATEMANVQWFPGHKIETLFNFFIFIWRI